VAQDRGPLITPAYPDAVTAADAPTPAAPTIRPATRDDVDIIVHLATAAYRATGDDAGWTTESHLLDGDRTNPTDVAAAIDDADTRVLVAERADAVVGVIKVEKRGVDGALFGLFAVDPTTQSGGTGSRLLDAAEQVAGEEWARSWMELEVLRQRTDLQAWYRRRGYEPTGETEPFPYDDDRFGLPRTDDLVFDVYRRPL
jgi:ribosomal protein S18 acetylase RimI-like enzyme